MARETGKRGVVMGRVCVLGRRGKGAILCSLSLYFWPNVLGKNYSCSQFDEKQSSLIAQLWDCSWLCFDEDLRLFDTMFWFTVHLKSSKVCIKTKSKLQPRYQAKAWPFFMQLWPEEFTLWLSATPTHARTHARTHVATFEFWNLSHQRNLKAFALFIFTIISF